ncbi:hypothetical protein CRE_06181 [Caenorhabditis remanei]|uniref:Uncharacterized protein n=1 Tax=Caenorhabditis remanei TaxID=31234 RepID=E3NK49_CAERE|nr:hypothetical protein CRE_06181 [Caenorhabditis remanei]
MKKLNSISIYSKKKTYQELMFFQISKLKKKTNSARRPMTLICVRPDVSDFFSTTIPIWNSIICNTHDFLPPGKFVSLLNNSINRL